MRTLAKKHGTENILRRCRFSPYRAGSGPRFALTTWATGRTDSMGKSIIAYRLVQVAGKVRTTLFEGEDFRCSPLDCTDSDAAVANLMAFLTLKPGDTDAEYFENYTDTQREFAEQHAETLACVCAERFGRA